MTETIDINHNEAGEPDYSLFASQCHNCGSKRETFRNEGFRGLFQLYPFAASCSVCGTPKRGG